VVRESVRRGLEGEGERHGEVLEGWLLLVPFLAMEKACV
jgi:hypothetical protein